MFRASSRSGAQMLKHFQGLFFFFLVLGFKRRDFGHLVVGAGDQRVDVCLRLTSRQILSSFAVHALT